MVLPLLAVYEVLAILLQSRGLAVTRNGVDMWLRDLVGLVDPQPSSADWFLRLVELFGFHGVFVLAVILLGFFFVLLVSIFRDRPIINFKFMLIAVLESGVYVWVLALGTSFVTTSIIQALSISDADLLNLMLAVGAGVYEELIFRAVGYGLLSLLLIRFLQAQRGWVIKAFLAIITSFIFSWAHNLSSTDFVGYIFLYRFIMGLFFCLLYEIRGFGIVVWTHTLYDVFVLFMEL